MCMLNMFFADFALACKTPHAKMCIISSEKTNYFDCLFLANGTHMHGIKCIVHSDTLHKGNAK